LILYILIKFSIGITEAHNTLSLQLLIRPVFAPVAIHNTAIIVLTQHRIIQELISYILLLYIHILTGLAIEIHGLKRIVPVPKILLIKHWRCLLH